MELLRAPTEPPLTGPNSLAIAIAGSPITGDARQRHVGILYRNEAQSLLLLHLGWHEKLYHHYWPSKDYHWLEVTGIDPEVQELFVDWAVIVAVAAKDKTSPIPYSAFFNPTDNFDSSGHFINRQDGTGLTCATFILALFADYKLPLISAETWPKRDEDSRWFFGIWKRLRETVENIDIHLFRQFKQRRFLRRFRPEEVVAAGAIFEGAALGFEPVAAKLAELQPSFPS